MSKQDEYNELMEMIYRHYSAEKIFQMIYCAVKKVKLNRVVKQGNVITITYDTELAGNAKNCKKAQLTFTFVDGVSEDIATNDFFSNICRYIKE